MSGKDAGFEIPSQSFLVLNAVQRQWNMSQVPGRGLYLAEMAETSEGALWLGLGVHTVTCVDRPHTHRRMAI